MSWEVTKIILNFSLILIPAYLFAMFFGFFAVFTKTNGNYSFWDITSIFSIFATGIYLVILISAIFFDIISYLRGKIGV